MEAAQPVVNQTHEAVEAADRGLVYQSRQAAGNLPLLCARRALEDALLDRITRWSTMELQGTVAARACQKSEII